MSPLSMSPRPTPKRQLVRLAVILCAALLTSVARVEAQTGQDAERFESVQSRPAGTPLMAIVALRNQRITIYDADGWILRAPISSGQTGYETPAGIYSVIQKEAEHYSNLYDDASMPFMQRITWSGIALHAGVLPGYPASHGCVRMPYEFAEQLFDMTQLGLRVIVTRNDISPAAMAHPALFTPKPAGIDMALAEPSPTTPPADGPSVQRAATLKSIAATKAAQAEVAASKLEEVRLAAVRKVIEAARAATAVRVAEFAKFKAEAQLAGAQNALESAESPEVIELVKHAKADALTKVADADAQLTAAKVDAQPKAEAAARAREDVRVAETAKAAALDAAQEATRQMSPISVFISRKTQRLYVRQAFQPLLETAVTIRDPDQPIGTHIYTALDYTKEGADLRWSVVSMYSNLGKHDRNANGGRRRRGDRRDLPMGTDVSSARAALERIAIPQDAIDRISELVSPGSSLIISDEGMSTETGTGTDFVILMSGEPQGGIRIRHRDLEFD